MRNNIFEKRIRERLNQLESLIKKCKEKKEKASGKDSKQLDKLIKKYNQEIQSTHEIAAYATPKKKQQTKNVKDTGHINLTATILLICTLSLFILTNPSFTGLAVQQNNFNIDLYQTFNNNTNLSIYLNSSPSSMKLSGSGNGTFIIALGNLTVVNSSDLRNPGNFNFVCVDTCSLSNISNNISLRIDTNDTIYLTRLTYTKVQDPSDATIPNASPKDSKSNSKNKTETITNISINLKDKNNQNFGHYNITKLNNKYKLHLSTKKIASGNQLFSLQPASVESTVDIDGILDIPQGYKARFDKIIDEKIKTQVFAADTLEFVNATITLSKTGDVNTILECKSFNIDTFECDTWERTPIPFSDNGDTITFTVNHFSGYAGGNIDIINVQSYPVVGGNWTVRFTTNGSENLTINGTNGTQFGIDLDFLDLKCGDTVLSESLTNGVIYYENYSCEQEGSETSKVLTTGKHTLEFTYGNNMVYAYNNATNDSCGYVNEDLTLNSSISINGTCFTINASNLILDGNGFTITGNESPTQYGINVSGFNNTTIKNFAGINNFTHGIYGIRIESTNITNNTMVSSILQNTYGISLVNCSNNSITYNNISNPGATSFGIEINDSCSANNITSNVFYPSGNDADAITVINGYWNRIISNNITAATTVAKGIHLSNTDNNTVQSNTVLTTHQTNGLHISGGGNNTIIFNNVTAQSQSNAIVLVATSQSNVSSNNFKVTAGSQVAVSFSQTNFNIFNYNNVTSTANNAAGVTFTTTSSHNSLTGNNISTTGTGANAVFFDTGRNNTIYHGSVSGPASNDVEVDDGQGRFINVTFNATNVTFQSGGLGNLTIEWFLGVNVSNSTGNAIQNANVSTFNVSNRQVDSQLTAADGTITRLQLVGSFLNETDRVHRIPYIVNTTLAGYQTTSDSLNFSTTGSRNLQTTLNLGCGTINTHHTLDSDILINDTCFVIGASHIVIDGNGYTIRGNVSPFQMGINNTGGYDNITIRNFGNITNFTRQIFFDGVTDTTIFNNTLRYVAVLNAGGMVITDNSHNNNISYNTIFGERDAIPITTSNSNYVAYNYINLTGSGDGITFSGDRNNATQNTLVAGPSGSDSDGIRTSGDNNIIDFNNLSSSNTGKSFKISNSGDHNNFTENILVYNDSSESAVVLTSGINFTFVNNNISSPSYNDVEIQNVDAIFINNTLNKSNITFKSGSTGNLTLKWFVNVNVSNTSSNALQNANVSIFNLTKDQIDSQLTAADGTTTHVLLTEYFRNATDITYETPHLINTSLSGYANDSTTLNLSNTSSVTTAISIVSGCGVINEDFTLGGDINAIGECFTINASDIVLDGGGFTVTGDRTGAGVHINGFNNTTIRNFGGLNNFTNGINISNSGNSTLFNNTIHNANVSQGHGILMTLAPLNTNISHNFVNVTGPNGMGINDNLIAGLSGNSFTYNNVIAGGEAVYGIFLGGSNNNVSYNQVNATKDDSSAIYLSRDSNLISFNNITTTGEDAYPINFQGQASEANISNNRIITNGTGSFALNIDTGNHFISYNTINTTGVQGYGVFVDAGSSNITNNHITTWEGSSSGIRLDTSSNLITGNNLTTHGIAEGLYGASAPADNNILIANFFNQTNTSSNANARAVFFDTGLNNTMTNDTIVAANVALRIGSNTAEVTLINVTFDRSKVVFAGGTNNGNLTVKWFVDVNITNNSNNALQNINVTTYNASGTQVNTQLTASDGTITTLTLTEYFQNASDIFYSTPHTINASDSGLVNNSTTINLTTLESTSVTLQVQDIVDPVISISFPENGGSTSSTTLNTTFNWTFTEINPHICQYSLNGAENLSVPCAQLYENITLLDLTTNNITLYINDTKGNTANSAISFIGNLEPSIAQLTLNTTSVDNATSDNLTTHFTITDSVNDSVTNITDWRLNNTSIAILNLPFEAGSNSTFTKDFSTLQYSSNVTGATYNSTGGYNGYGAYEFDGVNDLINLSNNFNFERNGSFSFTFWLNAKSSDTFIIAKEDISNGEIGYNVYLKENGTIQLSLQNNNSSNFMEARSSSNISFNEWNHIVVAYNGSSNFTGVNIYINGVSSNVSGSSNLTKSIINSKNFQIGCKESCSVKVLNASIDSFAIWNRSISSSQVFALYNNFSSVIVSNETSKADNWTVCVTPADIYTLGTQVCSNNIIIRDPQEAPSIPDLVSPTNETQKIFANLTFIWSESNDTNDDPISYEILFGNEDFSDNYLNHSTNDTNYTNISLRDGVQYWKVRAYDNLNYSDFSESRKIDIIRAIINITSPANYTVVYPAATHTITISEINRSDWTNNITLNITNDGQDYLNQSSQIDTTTWQFTYVIPSNRSPADINIQAFGFNGSNNIDLDSESINTSIILRVTRPVGTSVTDPEITEFIPNATNAQPNSSVKIIFKADLDTLLSSLIVNVSYPNGTVETLSAIESDENLTSLEYARNFTINSTVNGTLNLSAKVTDINGLIDNASSTINIQTASGISLTANGSSNIRLIDPQSGTVIVENATATSNIIAGTYNVEVTTNKHIITLNEGIITPNTTSVLNYSDIDETIAPPSNRRSIETFEINSTLDFTNASFSFNYTSIEQSLADEDNIEAYKCNKVTDCDFVELNSTTDTTTNIFTYNTNNFSLFMIAEPSTSVVTTTTNIGVGGGKTIVTETITEQITKTQAVSFEIIVPPILRVNPYDIISTPVIIRNTGQVTLRNINLESAVQNSDIVTTFDTIVIPLIESGNQYKVNMKIIADTTPGTYEIVTTGLTNSPPASSRASLYLEVIDDENSTDTKARLEFARQLFQENPECLDLSELLNQAEIEINSNQLAKAQTLVESSINGCKNLIRLSSVRTVQPTIVDQLELLSDTRMSIILLIVLFATVYLSIIVKFSKPGENYNGKLTSNIQREITTLTKFIKRKWKKRK